MTAELTARRAPLVRLAACAMLLLGLAAGSGCQSGGQTGLLAGAGIGALAGQAIGGNTTATLIGTGVGAGVGYVIGNERDRSQARDMSARQQREIDDLRRQQEAARQSEPTTAPRSPAPPTSIAQHNETGPLANTRWSVVSLSPRDIAEPFVSMIVDFQPGGRVTSTVTREDGSVDVHNERYRVVGDTLILNRHNYLVNARFGISGDELIISADRFSAVMRRLPS